MTWLLVLATAWMTLAGLLALVIGRAVRVADRRQTPGTPPVPDFVPAEWTTSPITPR
ncbi:MULTISPECIES: hypothetical protein [unclassified Blastococcus]